MSKILAKNEGRQTILWQFTHSRFIAPSALGVLVPGKGVPAREEDVSVRDD